MFNSLALPIRHRSTPSTSSSSSAHFQTAGLQHHRQQPEPSCYFSFVPNPSDHYSVETPLASPELCYDPPTPLSDPTNPLLALRPPSALLTHYIPMEASKLMQFQTSAAHPRRRDSRAAHTPSTGTTMAQSMFGDAPPPPVRRNGSDSSASSGSSGRSSDLTSPILGAGIMTCSRCQTQGLQHDFVQYTVGVHYCPQCARIVGCGG